jgi:hypothetical protein
MTRWQDRFSPKEMAQMAGKPLAEQAGAAAGAVPDYVQTDFIHIGTICHAPSSEGKGEPPSDYLLVHIAAKLICANSVAELPLQWADEHGAPLTDGPIGNAPSYRLVNGVFPSFTVQEEAILKEVLTTVFLRATLAGSDEEVYAFCMVRGDLFHHFYRSIAGNKPYSLEKICHVMLAGKGDMSNGRLYMTQFIAFAEKHVNLVRLG